MATDNPLFGDAKATARAFAGDRKLKQLEDARRKVEQDASPDTLSDLATALFDNGKYDEAEKILSDLAQQYSDNIRVLCDLGFTYKHSNKVEEAIRTFKRVVELDSKHALARCAENELWSLDPTYKPSWLKR